MDRVDCLVFEDQLDALVRGALSPDGVAQMRAHASGCPTCASLARLEEHLSEPTLEVLEAQVPDVWVASMWTDVQGALRSRRARRSGRRGWVAPTLAAAAVALVVLNGLTLRALSRATALSEDLTEQVLDQQRRLTEAGAPAVSGGGSALVGRSASLRALGGRSDVTVGDLRALLADLPSNAPVIRASRVAALTGSRLVPLAWREALTRLRTGGDVTAAELLEVLDDLDIPGGTPVPASRLFDLLS